MTDRLLRVCDLSIGISTPTGQCLAVENANLHLEKGEILGIVGESGCGKSLTALSIAGLLPEGVNIAGGRIIFDGVDLKTLRKEEMRRIQGKDVSMIFQEPMTSLNPLMKIGKQVSENLRIHYKLTGRELRDEVMDAFGKVGLPRADDIFNSYPHQLSGGMRQRVMIAMAIICKPKLIIADEPTTALDVTIQAQILELLRKINRELNTAILFISHDLGVINQLCDRVAVMYAGSIIEEGNVRSIFVHPVHEYTKGLIESIPGRDKRGRRLANIPGKVPSITEMKFGCGFAPRCSKASDACFLNKPKTVRLSESHAVSCYLADQESEMEYVSI